MSQTGCKLRNPGVEGLCPSTAAEDMAMPSSWHGGTSPLPKTQPQLNKHCPGQKVPKFLHTSLRLSFHPSEQVKAVMQTAQAENKHLIAQAHQTARKSAGTHRWSTQVKKTGSSQCHHSKGSHQAEGLGQKELHDIQQAGIPSPTRGEE